MKFQAHTEFSASLQIAMFFPEYIKKKTWKKLDSI